MEVDKETYTSLKKEIETIVLDVDTVIIVGEGITTELEYVADIIKSIQKRLDTLQNVIKTLSAPYEELF